METSRITLPIAEIFTSPQGEGYWTGVLCTFVRLAGCNVGRPYTTQERLSLNVLQPHQEKCTAWNGETFACDTDYKKTRSMTVYEILKEVGDVPRMLLTGGEPLMHDVDPLIQLAWARGKYVHIETSGTKMLPSYRRSSYTDPANYKLWIAVSPKQGYLPEMLDIANEIRVLVNKDTDEEKLIGEFEKYISKLFISAINDEHSFNMDSIRKCLAMQLKYPKLRISVQTHKILECR